MSAVDLDDQLDEIEQEKFDTDRELHDNIAVDIVEYSRANIVKNEQQALLTFLSWLTGYFAKEDRFVNVVEIGTSSSGKTHLVRNMKKLIPRNDRYHATAGSDKSFLDDEEWENRRVFIGDEWNQLGGEIKEFMKKVAGGDEGYTYSRNQQDDSSKTGFSPEKWTKEAKPFSFQYAQFSMDFEMWNRLFKCYVDESEEIHRAIGRKEAGHNNITINGEHEYIEESSDLRYTILDHVRNIPRDAYTYMPEWVWHSCEPIFQHGRSEVNRVYGMIFNMIRASALLHHHKRDTVTVTDDDGNEHDAYVVEPQDVANVLDCRHVILGTTHELEPRKMAIIEAIDNRQGFNDKAGKMGATLDDIHNYMESASTDMTRLRKDQLREILRELDQNYYIDIHENAAENGAHLYSFNSLSDIGLPRLTGLDKFEISDGFDVDDPYEGCVSPISGLSFKESVEKFRKDVLERDMLREGAEASNESVDTDDDGHATLGASSSHSVAESDLTKTEREVHRTLMIYSGGKEFDYEYTDAEYLVGAVNEGENLAETDPDGTILDHEDKVWNRSDKADGWVTNEFEALEKVESAMTSLRNKGLYDYEVVEESDDGTPETIEIEVKELQ